MNGCTGAGRPTNKIEINFNQPKISLNQIKVFCKNKTIKEKVRIFARALMEMTEEPNDVATQTKSRDTFVNDMFLEELKSKSAEEQGYVISSIMMEMDDTERLKLIMIIYHKLDIDDQCKLLAYIGHGLNQSLYKSSKQNVKPAMMLNLNDLKKVTKSEFYATCDRRLQSFIDNLTHKARYSNDDDNFKTNIFENMLKARNQKYASEVGIKEHMVVYLA